MPIVRKPEARKALSPREASDQIFYESFRTPFDILSLRELHPFFPKVDVSETARSIQVVADLPGIDPEEVEVTVGENAVTLIGKVETKEEEGEKDFYRMERGYGEFSREILLPVSVVAGKASIKMKNGVLTVVVPKKNRARKRV